ncbi:MAG: ribonuclease III [Chitinivibrionia bacterium]|nr:ribonuclease III [Chitinivibrionia bacterium]
MKRNEIDELQKSIGYYFKDSALLFHALTHKSAINPEIDPTGIASNERLEILGDSILDFLVVEELYGRRPVYTEGQITQIKSLIVSRKIIGEVADGINLKNAMIFGKSYKNLENPKTDVCSNAFEALIAAVYLDGGLDNARKILEKKLFPFIETALAQEENINYKALVQEFLQSKGLSPVKYAILSEDGPEHKKTFTVEIEIENEKIGTAQGSSKKIAEQKVAKIAAKKLGIIE